MPACARCGEVNPERARFCLACGNPFAVPASVGEVRKVVTVLFSDITGSTSLAERTDPETLRRILERYYACMRAVIRRHGGNVEKFVGDAVMAVFGVPRVHEDDALRGVRAAADIAKEIDELNEDLEREWGLRLQVKTGVNTGEVVAGDSARGYGFVVGDAVNVASRLGEDTARPDEILIGEATWRLVRDAVDVEPVGPLQLAGKAQPMRAFRVRGLRPGAQPFARRLDLPIVGRERELAELQDAYELAKRERSCRLVTLVGGIGVGKSRLANEFLRRVAGEATAVSGRCLPYGAGITFWPLLDVLKGLVGDDVREGLDRLLAGEPEREQIVAALHATVAAPEGAAAPADAAVAVVRLFEALARRRPLVALFDDLQWAEPAFVELVEEVARRARGPILVLCLARPEAVAGHPGLAAATSVALGPLSEEDCLEVLERLVGDAELDPDVCRLLGPWAEGNPLFAEEILEMLIEEGLLRQQDGVWTAARRLTRLRVPPTIQALLQAKVERLGEAERAVAQRGAVEGRVFHRGAVSALAAAEDDEAGLDACLAALVRKDVVHPDRPAFEGDDAYRFRHVLLRDAAYASLPKRARADLHERYAAWLERTAAGRVAEYEEVIGYHLEQAYLLLSEIAPADDRAVSLARRATTYLSASGDHARARGDERAAENLLARAEALATAV